MNDNNTYYVYYSYNQGTVPGKPFTELNVGEDVFISGCATALVVDRADITETDNELHKVKTTEKAEFKGDPNLKVFIKGKYEAKTVYYNKIYTAAADTAKEAQLGLLEQGCTEFCDMDLNKGAGGKYIYFVYCGYSLNEKAINELTTAEAKENEIERQKQEAVYDIICTVGEDFHPEGILTDRYQLYYAPVAKEDKNHNLIGTDLNEGTTGPKIYMYYATTFAAKRYNETAMKNSSKILSTMPKDYMKSPLTKIGFALYDYVPYSQDLVVQSSGSNQPVAWEYVLKHDYSSPVELNEAAMLRLMDYDTLYVTTTITPATEEIIKAIPILIYAFVITDNREKLIASSFALGIGFALFENTYILINSVDAVSIEWALVRGFSTALMHGICTAAVGYGMSFVKKKLFYCGTFALLMLATIYHGIFNMLVQSENLKYFGFVLPLATYIPVVIALIARVINRKKTEKVD